jgi:hypothetical protein
LVSAVAAYIPPGQPAMPPHTQFVTGIAIIAANLSGLDASAAEGGMMDATLRTAIEETCRGLVVALVHHYDHGRAAEAAALFTPDGVWVKSRVPYHGREAIVASFAAQPPSLVMRHFTSNILVTVADETNASAVTYYMAFVAQGQRQDALPLTGPASIGEWRDRFVMTSEGWRFARREGSRVFSRNGS